MRICFITDASSIHARRWIEYFCKPENEVFVLSTVSNPQPIEGAEVYDLYRGQTVKPDSSHIAAQSEGASGLSGAGVLNKMRDFAKGIPITSSLYANMLITRYRYLYYMLRLKGRARTIVKELQPDLVHCLRIPIAGFIGALIEYHPLVVSSWGSDLVTFARKYWFYRWLTCKTMRRADAYIPDTIRDLYIAAIYDFSPAKPSLVLPVTGGLKLEEFTPYRQPKDNLSREKIGVALEINLLIMTRGFKSPFSNNEALIRALPQIVQAFPNTLLIMVGETRSPGYSQIKTLAGKLGMTEHVRLISWLGYSDFVTHLAASDIMVSTGLSDGCPVSMLEGMVCGVIPAMSNDFPIQEWVTDGWNGYLFDPRDPGSIAQAIIRALKNKDNFETMRERNWNLLAEEADYHKNMKDVETLYQKLVETRPANI